MVIKILRNFVLVLLLVISFQIKPVQANNLESRTAQEAESGEVIEKKMNLFEELHYRMFLKDTRDFFDYLLLAIFVVGLLIVLVFKNTHYVVVKKTLEAKTFLDSGSTYSVEELVEEPVILEEEEILTNDDIEEENPEILSSEDLEEENSEMISNREKEENTKKVPNKRSKKKRRA